MPYHGLRRCECGGSWMPVGEPTGYPYYKIRCEDCGKVKRTTSRYGRRRMQDLYDAQQRIENGRKTSNVVPPVWYVQPPGGLWHVVASDIDGIVETACGRSFTRGSVYFYVAKTDSDRPDKSRSCYNCSRTKKAGA